MNRNEFVKGLKALGDTPPFATVAIVAELTREYDALTARAEKAEAELAAALDLLADARKVREGMVAMGWIGVDERLPELEEGLSYLSINVMTNKGVGYADLETGQWLTQDSLPMDGVACWHQLTDAEREEHNA
jgi:hypothetical protein